MKLFHTADIHFGVENYGRVDPATGIHSRLLDFNTSLTRLVDDALEQQIDAVIFSGDAYKTAYPTPTQQKLLMAQLLRLQKAAIPVVIIVGNHDHPLSFGKAHALDVFGYLPVDGFYVFSKPELQVIPTKSGLLQVVGIPWPARNNVIAHEAHHHKSAQEITHYLSERVSMLIAHFAQQVDRNLPALLAGHLTVSTGIFSGSEKCAVYGTDPIFLPSQLALPQFDYVALGHLHRYQNLNPGGSPAVVYSGSIERVDFGERKEEKGYCAVSIHDRGGVRVCEHHFIRLPTRPMIQIEVVMKEGVSQTELLLQEIKKQSLDGAIVKIIYHLQEHQRDTVDLTLIQRACSSAMYLVGIIPVRKQMVRERRTTMSVDMSFATLLEQYIDSKEHLVKRRELLLQKGMALYDQIDKEIEQ